MHGRKRAEYKHRLQEPELAAKVAQKAQQWYTLSEKSLQLRQATDNAPMALSLLDKMLRVNPDPSHLWNHRRMILLQTPKEEWIQGELTLIAAALERNPKAYGPWFHRKWVLQKARAGKDLLAQELALTEQFLKLDERNFHCWNFRRFLVGLELDPISGSGAWNLGHTDEVFGAQIPPNIAINDSNDDTAKPSKEDIAAVLQREWEFTKTKIVQNFSNFSAFHYRSKLMVLIDNEATGWTPLNPADGQSTLEAIANSEWSLMENILFTEPDDQTVWWYHRFVLDFFVKHSSTEAWYKDWIQAQADTLQMLVDDEPECKWGLLGYHLVLSRMEGSKEATEKMESLLDQLMQVDPDRMERYETMRNKQ